MDYYMRVFCGADSSTRLAFSGSPYARGRTGLIVWTAPSTATYYLRFAPNDTVGGYRVQTGVDAPSPGERARDQRDVFVSSSMDGSAWTTPVRVNDDPGWLDDWLPELAVSLEGYPYAAWLDWRDAPANCGGQSNLYTTRSLDGGATWAASQRVTSVSSAWSFVGANVMPNQGDYVGLTGAPALLYGWADGRLGDADVFSGTLPVSGTLSGPPDSTWTPGGGHVLPFTANDPNVLFANPYTLSVASDRAWPGFPIVTSSFTAPAGGAVAVSVPMSVPDTAAVGVNHLRAVLQQANGIRLDSVTVTITIPAPTAVFESPPPGVALRGAWPNPASRDLHVSFTLARQAPAVLEILDLAGRRVIQREVGGLGPGTHAVDLGREAAALPPGLYALRLTQNGTSATRKLAILR
jgi:hypothetical protein